MIASNTQTIERTGNMTGDVVEMRIAAHAAKKLMQQLTAMYEDSEAAVVREVASNALDAHLAAGVTKPIEVRLPQGFNTNLEIQDFGIGMSVDTIHEIYSAYGASTKDQDNTQVGAFGMGCKAPLAYTDQFVVTSIKDGTRIQVVVSRNADGGGSMTIVDTRSTDEGNGTTVSIPVGTYHQFPRKAAEFFAYWPEGSVLVDGQKPKRFEGLKLTDDLYVVKSGGYEPDHKVVMGNVAYPVPNERIPVGLPYGHAIVAYVPIGAVAVPMPRESLLLDDAQTVKTLKEILVSFQAEAVKAVEREVAKAADHHEAIRIATKWHAALNHNQPFNYTYKGTPLPEKLPGTCMAVRHSAYKLSDSTTYPKGLPISVVPNALFITGWDYAKWSPSMRRRLNKYMEESNLFSPEHYVMCKDAPAGPWVKSSQIIKWDDVKKIKLESTRTQSGRIPGSYDLQTHADGYFRTGVPGSEIDTTKPVFYTERKWEIGIHVEAMKQIHDEFTIVYLPSTRQAKFKRMCPHVKPVRDEIKNAADTWYKGLSLDVKKAWTLHQDAVPEWFTQLMAAEKKAGVKLLDTRMSEFGRLAAIDLTDVSRKARMFRNLLPGWHFKGEPVGDDPTDDYPLFDARAARNGSAKHVIEYMNWHYKTTIEPKEA